MGRRSRNRAASGADGPDGAPARPPARRTRAADTLNPARRIIAAYLGAAAVIGVLTLAGIATVGGTFGPPLVFVAILALSAGALRFFAGRLAGAELTDEDRLMRLLATGVLITAVILALISAVVSLVVG